MGETDRDRERDEELITIEDIIKCESFPQRMPNNAGVGTEMGQGPGVRRQIVVVTQTNVH